MDDEVLYGPRSVQHSRSEGWVSLPVSEFEQLHGEIRAWRAAAIERDAEIERLRAEVDRLSRALSHS